MMKVTYICLTMVLFLSNSHFISFLLLKLNMKVSTNLVNIMAWSCGGIPGVPLIQEVTALRTTVESAIVPEGNVSLLFSINCALWGVLYNDSLKKNVYIMQLHYFIFFKITLKRQK